ncbi:MAG: hypothetical protein E7449_03905 [Ruminococcaceae bacterium]|nr:hypothetical protein [Oscillospiraceae bacterium]
MQTCKTYVSVIAQFRDDGALLPLQIEWEDGRVFAVDRVLDVRPAASLKAGGYGMRYTCRIAGKQTYLFYERDRWFVERKGA